MERLRLPEPLRGIQRAERRWERRAAHVVRDDAASLALVGVPGNPDAAFASVLPGRQYTLQFSAGAVPLSPKLYLDNVAAGEWVRITLPYPQAPAKMVRDYWAGNPMGAVATSRSSRPAPATNTSTIRSPASSTSS